MCIKSERAREIFRWKFPGFQFEIFHELSFRLKILPINCINFCLFPVRSLRSEPAD